MSYTDQDKGTGKQAWGRELHLLNILTYGQMKYLEGEQLQNPFYMSKGLEIMLQVLGPMITELRPKRDSQGRMLYGPKGHIITEASRGINTPTYQKYSATLAKIQRLVNAGMQPNIGNKTQVLSQAYSLCVALNRELIQKSSDYHIDFKPKTDPTEAYKDEE